jgi:HK97 family phage major capsid protein
MPGPEILRGIEARQSRAAVFDRATINVDARTCEIAFSSEEPVERYWGVEILGHSAGEIDMDWIGGGTAPVLCDHNARDIVGVVESVTLGADRKARAVVRFGKSERAAEVMQDVGDGIRANVSVGYELLQMDLVKEEKGQPPVYRAKRWRPLEVSFVSIPADMTVGVGREAVTLPSPLKTEPEPRKMEAATPIHAPATPDQIHEASRRHVEDIMALAVLANQRDAGHDAIVKGLTIEQFRGQLLAARADQTKPLIAPPSEIGLSPREVRSFSLSKLLVAQADRSREAAPLEWDAVRTAGEAMIKAGHELRHGTVLPFEILNGAIPGVRNVEGRMIVGPGGSVGQRDLSTGTTAAGGALVQTDVLGMSFIDLLRNAMMVRRMGATVLGGLMGNVAIPRQTGATTAGWVAEAGAATESDITFSQLTLAPKTVHAIQDFTRQLLMQGSPDVEGLVRTDLALQIALAIDVAALHGTGASNQPTGLAATAGIGSVAGGTNGAVPTWDNIVDLETSVANNNAAIESLGYLTNSRVRGRLKRAPIISGQPVFIWGGMPGTAAPTPGSGLPMSVMNEYPAAVTNQVSSTLTKGTSTGVCSAIFFGNWRDLIIGEWGGLETLSDNITLANVRVIRVHGYQTADVGLRRPASFAAMLDALTA